MGQSPGGTGVADRLAVAARRAREARVADARAEVEAAREAAGGALDRDDAVLAGTLVATACFNAGQLEEAQRELAAVRPLLPDTGPIRQARFQAISGIIAHQLGDDEAAITALVTALATVDRDLPASEELAAVLGNCAAFLAHTQLFTVGVEAGERAVAAAVTAGLPPGRFQLQTGFAYLTWAIRLEHLGLADEARDRWRSAVSCLAPALDWGDDLGPMFATQGHGYLALCQARLGWPADARHTLQAAADGGGPGEVDDLHRLLSHVQAAVLFAEGKYPEATAMLTGCWADVADRYRPPWTEDVAYLLARAAEATADWRAALRWYAEVHERYGRADYEVALARAAAAQLRVEQEALLRRSQQLESDSRSDPLTGVANRRVLDEALRRRVSGRRRSDRPTTVVVVDIDHFKQINDERGHLVGDQVLRQVGAALREHVREGDVCARYGGDEFVLVLTATAEQAAVVAARAAAEIANFPWGQVTPGLEVTVTCGLAERQPDHNPGTLFGDADADLLAAKRARHRQHRPPVVPLA